MKLFLASLIAISSTAAQAGPNPPTPPGPPKDAPHVCAANGAPLFSIVHRTEDTTTRTDSTFALTTTGAWTFTQLDPKGAKTREASGCLDDKRLATVRKELERATWKTERAEMTCMAISPSFTEYYASGKLRFTARLCQPEHLDARTQKSLDAIEKIATDLTKPGPIESSRGKP